MATEDMEIDDSLYSRQRYVLGDTAMHRMANSSVLVYGMGGLGIEIAKNVVLAGVKSITVQDPHVTKIQDLGTQFFLHEADVNGSKNRALSSTAQLAELNPYVSVMAKTDALTMTSDLSYLKGYQCIVLIECPMNIQKRVNEFCRSQSPQISFISAGVYGILAFAFSDFGDNFHISDPNGEEPIDIFVNEITKGNPGIVKCMEERVHGLTSGDVVTFREVKGMTALNGKQCEIKEINATSFSICDTSGPEFGTYESGGIFTEVKVPKNMSFTSLEKQIKGPTLMTPDLCKFEAPLQLHLGHLAICEFLEKNGRLPNAWNDADAEAVVAMAKSLNELMECKADSLDESLLLKLAKCSDGCFAPLCAVFGGIVAQEALKSLTGKFTPLNQWLYLDTCEVIPSSGNPQEECLPKNDRYDNLRICIGQKQLQKLADSKLFMVGCGAIGCEMLKNYALLGVSCGQGKITITDNDLIEKSNLNRQFLFRPCHIQKPKSTTGAQAALHINPGMNIEAQQHKVCPETEKTIYTDSFFGSQDLMVNALDNLEARRYMDGRCVSNQRALLESGTMGTKGHVQVIVPHITESYTSTNDPADESYPYCTVKSFPATLEHCIQWARDKFEECFVQNAQLFNKFFQTNQDLKQVAQQLVDGMNIDGAVKVSKILEQQPKTWDQCVSLARIRFEKYFNHKAKQLLHAFPMDNKCSDGRPFWTSPKRPPSPLVFNPDDELHVLFVTATAKLLADVYQVKFAPENKNPSVVQDIASKTCVPEFQPSSKKMVTDETVKKDDDSSEPLSSDVVERSGHRIQKLLQQPGKLTVHPLHPVDFEKDDDENEHINFIYTTTNLRAQMYGIDIGERLKIKKIAGRIVPAIATSTATVSGLVSVELIKVLNADPLDKLKNCYMNLALPMMLLSEPGPVTRTVLREGLSVTIWDKWDIHGSEGFTLQQFKDQVKEKFGFEAQSIVQGVKIIYMPFMPGHNKRLSQPMDKLLRAIPGQNYVDLSVTFDGDNDEEDVPGPPVRYFFQ